MARLPVLTVPNPLLRQKSLPVSSVSDEDRQLFNDMLETMEAEDGIGLAAIQVGVPKRLLVVDIGRDVHPYPLKIANPEITWCSPELTVTVEGCLSVPEQHAEVERSSAITLSYVDENNQPQELKAKGILAICIQHEIDHLNGVLYVDHLSAVRRRILVERAEKAFKRRKQQEKQG